MRTCKKCGSHAINPGMNGRDSTSDLDLCDVCYWRNLAEAEQKDAARYRELRDGSNWPAVFAAYDAPEPLTGAALDEAIDAAIAEQEK